MVGDDDVGRKLTKRLHAELGKIEAEIYLFYLSFLIFQTELITGEIPKILRSQRKDVSELSYQFFLFHSSMFSP